MNSSANEGNANIQMNFTWGTDLNEAMNDIRTRIDACAVARRMPTRPSSRSSTRTRPHRGSRARKHRRHALDRVQLRELAENILSPRLERVQGVAAVTVGGGLRRQIRRPLAREDYGARSVGRPRRDVIRNENQNIPDW